MSDPIVKGAKRSPARPAPRYATTSSAKNRTLASKSAHPKPIAKRAAAEKAPVRKATKSNAPAPAKKAAGKSKPANQKALSVSKAASTKARTPVKAVAVKATPKKAAPVAKQSQKQVKKGATPPSQSRPASSKAASKPAKFVPKPVSKPFATRKQTPPPPPTPRQPTRDEAAALLAFERARKEFTRGRFVEARNLFRSIIEKHAGVSEVTARSRTYLNITETRLRTEAALPRDADSLYDRGVIELNRGEFVAAQELFERALKREPEAAHVHYGLAAARARLGAIETALEALRRALDLQPNLRVRAQHDQDLTVLRSDPDYERLIFAPRL